MPLFSYLGLADAVILFLASFKVYASYKKERAKEYYYLVAFLFTLAVTMSLQGLSGSLIHDPLFINLLNIISFSFGLHVSVAFISQISFILLKKPALGNFFFWVIMGIAIVSLMMSASAHSEAVRFESVLDSIPTLTYWQPHYTTPSMVLMAITIVIGIACFPFLILILSVNEIRSRTGRRRLFLLVTGLFIVGSAGIVFAIAQAVSPVLIVEILTITAVGGFIGFSVFSASFFIKERGQEQILSSE